MVLQVGLILTQFLYFSKHATSTGSGGKEKKWMFHVSQKHTKPIVHKIPTAKKNIICPSALKLFNNTTELLGMIEEQTQFHQSGGSLASIESYLNRHMQSTLDRLSIQFIPKSNNGGKPVPNAIEYLNEYYASHKVKRGGYGMPLPGKFSGQNVNEGLVGKRWIDVLEAGTNERFDVSMGPIGPTCSNIEYFDKGNYGSEKVFCLPLDYKKGNGNATGGSCDLYSIGSNDQWGFEREVMKKFPECVTHTFDCTLTDNIPKRKPQNENVKFYPFCIGSNNAKHPYLPYQQLCGTANTTVSPKLLKMDVEGFEYDVLLSLLSADPSIWPEQIMIEVHWSTRMVDVKWMLRTRQAAEIALLFGTLFNVGGYIPVYRKLFPECHPCAEVLLVRAVC